MYTCIHVWRGDEASEEPDEINGLGGWGGKEGDR